jgi:multidrug transporter EmrE-like cation transporter
MFLGILAAAGAGLLWVVMGTVISRTARRKIDLLTLMAAYGAVSLVGAWVFMVDYHELARGVPDRLGWLAVIMIGAGVLDSAAVVLMQRAMCTGHHGVVWTMSKSGFVLPFLTSMLFFGERSTTFKLASLLAILASVVCFGIVSASNEPILPPAAAAPAAGPARSARSWYLLAMGSLLITGLVQSIATVPSQWQGWADSCHLRVPIYYIGVAGGYGVISLLLRHRPTLKVLPWALLVSVTTLVSLALIFYSLDTLKKVDMTSMAYPIGMGVSITAFALYSLLVLREPVRPLYVIALLLGVAGVALGALG